MLWVLVLCFCLYLLTMWFVLKGAPLVEPFGLKMPFRAWIGSSLAAEPPGLCEIFEFISIESCYESPFEGPLKRPLLV